MRKSGAVAQLGERMNGIHEVVGSIPISSTRNIRGLARLTNLFSFAWLQGTALTSSMPR